MYTVKEAAALLGLTEHTVRYYTDKGLVPSVKRDKNNNRLFDEESMNWLTGVKYLKQCGMSIETIREYVRLCLCLLYTSRRCCVLTSARRFIRSFGSLRSAQALRKRKRLCSVPCVRSTNKGLIPHISMRRKRKWDLRS